MLIFKNKIAKSLFAIAKLIDCEPQTAQNSWQTLMSKIKMFC